MKENKNPAMPGGLCYDHRTSFRTRIRTSRELALFGFVKRDSEAFRVGFGLPVAPRSRVAARIAYARARPALLSCGLPQAAPVRARCEPFDRCMRRSA